MTEPSDAYAALVDALIALRRDAATQRFDEYLEYATENGRIDEPSARALRWWQRQSVRGVEEHLEGLLPVILRQLEAADQAAIRAVEISDQAWRAAAGAHPPQSHSAPPEARTVQPEMAQPEMAQPETAQPEMPRPEMPQPEQPEPVEQPAESVPQEQSDSSQAQDGAPVQRTLTAGLTVIPEERT
jgi:hypothetical protein